MLYYECQKHGAVFFRTRMIDCWVLLSSFGES